MSHSNSGSLRWYAVQIFYFLQFLVVQWSCFMQMSRLLWYVQYPLMLHAQNPLMFKV